MKCVLFNFEVRLHNLCAGDWRCDQYRWHNEGVTKLPRNNPKFKKLYFSIDTGGTTSKNFQRHGYQLLNSSSPTLIHYLGDENVAVSFPHGNDKHSAKPFTRTCPSYLHSCKELVSKDKAHIVYKNEVAAMRTEANLVPVQTPRNTKQLRNLRFQQLQQTRLSQDALYNLHEIAYDLPGFVWKIVTFPDLICVCGLQEILDELDRVLLLDSPSQLLSYDTTFQLGDFYVSPLLFRHALFKQHPCIPAMFLIHERKFTTTHQEMLKTCAERVPMLLEAKCALVTDKEKSIVNAIRAELPEVAVVHCWNHILRDVRLWCRKHGAPACDVSVYSNHLLELFHSPTEAEYETRLQERSQMWDSTFESYFRKEIHPDVNRSISRWVLQQHNVYNPYSGVTNNQSESFNRLVISKCG